MSFLLTSQNTPFESFLQLTPLAVGNVPKHVIWVGNGPKHVICAEIRRLDATTICVDVLTGISGYELKDGVGSVLIIFDQFFSKRWYKEEGVVELNRYATGP